MGAFGSSSLSVATHGKLQTLLYILILLHTYVIVEVSLSTNNGAVEKVYRVNNTIRINCSLNDSHLMTNDSYITWTFNGEVLDEKTSQLVIENAQFEHSGVYVCKLDGHSQEEGVRWDIKVGLPPTEATDIRCDCYDFVSFNCSWKDGRPTNLETTHVLQYDGSRNFRIAQTNCQRNRTCPNPDKFANVYVRVNSSNALTDVLSNLEKQNMVKIMTVTPVRSAHVNSSTSNSLQVSWLAPQEYCSYPRTKQGDMQYLVRYKLENTQHWISNESIPSSGLPSRLYPTCDIHGLEANSVYTISISVNWPSKEIQPSKETLLQGVTKEKAPEQGVNLIFLCPRIEGTNEARLSWIPFPEDKSNGKILSYDITINENSSVIRKNSNVTEHRLQDLDLYSDYNTSIVARNSAGTSSRDECYIPALPQADWSAVIFRVLIIVGAVLFIVIFILAFKFYICFKKSKITEIKLPHRIQYDNFYLYGGPQRRAPCEEERYDELITQSLVEKGSKTCNSTIPNGKTDPSREPIMPEPITTK